jgi:putative transcriptional regulator
MMRHERKWTYDNLAEQSGVSRRSLVALETGDKVRPSNGSVETWYRLAKAFDVPIGDLLGALDREST